MRKLLVLAFLLYDIIAILTANRLNNYDYDDIDGSKRQTLLDERRNWRRNTLLNAEDHRDWDRKRYDYDSPRYLEDMDSKIANGIERQREMDLAQGYRHHRYEDSVDKMSLQLGKSSEVSHLGMLTDKDMDKKVPLELNCQRPNEKYEACFAGCSSVTCDNPRDRMQPCYPFCEAGCVCEHPYVRDDRTHKCVMPEDCTKGLKGIPDLGDEVDTRR